MKKINLSFLLICLINTIYSQDRTFIVHNDDTIHLERVDIKKPVSIKLDNAFLLMEYQPFINGLKKDQKEIVKRIRETENIIKKGEVYPGITLSQLKFLKSSLTNIDSIFKFINSQKSDTAWINYSLINRSNPLNILIINSLKTKNCIVLDENLKPQTTIVKRSGSQKTGEMTAVGLSYYYLNGNSNYFWFQKDWIN